MTSPWSGSCLATGRFFFINGPAGPTRPPRDVPSARPPAPPRPRPDRLSGSGFPLPRTGHILRGAILISLFGTLLLTLQVEPAVYFFPWHTAGMTVLQAGVFLFALPFARLPTGRLPFLFLGLWGILFLWAVTTVFWSTAPALTLQQALTVFLTPGLILVLVYCDRSPAATFWGFARGMAWFGTFLAAAGLLLFLGGESLVINQWEGLQVLRLGSLLEVAQSVHYLAGWTRISSLTGDPNTLALWLAFSLPCTWLLRATRRLSLPGFLGRAAVQGCALILTFSRAGVGMALLGLALVYLLLGRGAGGKYARAVVLATVLLAALLLISEYLSVHPGSGLFVHADGLLGRRDDAWNLAWQEFLRCPFTGAGFGMTRILLQEARLNLLHLHNSYFSVLSESGLLGLALFLLFWLGAMILVVWKYVRLRPSFPCIWNPPRGRSGGIAPKGEVRAGRGRWASSGAAAVLAGVTALLFPLLLHQFFETMILRTNFHTLLWLYLVGVASHPRVE